MRESIAQCVLLIALFSLTLTIEAQHNRQTTVSGTDAASTAPVSGSIQRFERSPMYFELNEGQFSQAIRFCSRVRGYTVRFEDTAIVLTFKGETILRMRWPSVGQSRRPYGEAPVETKSNYFIGPDPRLWRIDVPAYGRIRYPEAFPGTDLIFYGNRDLFEYDVAVGPGTDPSQLIFEFDNARSIKIGKSGDLILNTTRGEVIQRKPLIYEERAGKRIPIQGGYVMVAPNRVRFRIGRRDGSLPLVIDPVLDYSLLFGGSAIGGEYGSAIAVDSSGNAYVTGATSSSDFALAGTPFQNQLKDVQAAFVAKLNPTGTALVYNTYLGGSGGIDTGNSIAVDAMGNAYVTGQASSGNFPTTPGAYQTVLKGSDNVFVAKLNPQGSALIYSTYLGGTSIDNAYGIALDPAGSAYITGSTSSTDFPITPGAFVVKGLPGKEAFVTKLAPDGSGLSYSAILGPGAAGRAIILDSSMNAYVAGDTGSPNFPVTPGAFQTEIHTTPSSIDAFVSALKPDGSALIFSTLLGGGYDDIARGISRDNDGNIYVTGSTQSPDFPVTPGAFQTRISTTGFDSAFVTKLNPTATALVYSTVYDGQVSGTANINVANGIVLDSARNAIIVGSSSSYANSPLVSLPLASPVQAVPTALGGFGSGTNAFAAKFDATGSHLVTATYLGGGTGIGIAMDTNGSVYVAGSGNGLNLHLAPPGSLFPITFDSDVAGLNHGYVFVAKLTDPTPCSFSISPTSVTLPATASSTIVNVTASSNTCNWVAVGGQYWISTGPGSSGKGSGQATINASANTGTERVVPVSVAGSVFTLTQTANCTYTLEPAVQAIDSVGESGNVITVVSSSGCPLTFTSNAPTWLTVLNTSTPPDGVFNVRYAVAPNPGPPRTGTMTISGQTFTVNQAGYFACSYSLGQTVSRVPAALNSDLIPLNTQTPCTWTAVSNVPWISIPSIYQSGTGESLVVYTVAQNKGATRVGTITVGGQTFTVVQASPNVPGDFDGNGVPDLLWQNGSSRQVVVWYMGGAQGITYLSSNSLSGTVPGWTVVGAADINQDGTPDLIWQNDSTGQVVVWYMGGAQGNTYLSSNLLTQGPIQGWRAIARY